ncbi:transcription factor ILR3 [Lactuca sativa]|uniref:BHLH domain-containing protein n=1 Tax=Lactuca sativa TaxID=4236 RepID=A0A9R1X1U9_LACSA|nr:transcription factor ILR3 [Lactuca sativa]KAJ0195234.1 hypothetical protein LSAT_V11C700384630 [Lactuca sativa]
MVFPENTNWIYEVGLIDDIVVPDVYYTVPDSGFSWPIQATLNGSSSNPSLDLDGSTVDSDDHNDSISKNRGRRDNRRGRRPSNPPKFLQHKDKSKVKETCKSTPHSSSTLYSAYKAHQIDTPHRFLKLSSMLEPRRAPTVDKSVVLADAVQMLTQLRIEAQKLKHPSSDLQNKIKE